MGGGNIREVRVARANIYESSKRFATIPGPVRMAWMWSMTMLTTVEETSPLRGCLCQGDQPMPFEVWKREVGIRKLRDAESVWAELFERGLFAWREYEGRRYPHVEKFEQNQDRSRKARERREKRVLEPGNGPGMAGERSVNGPGMVSERSGNGQGMAGECPSNGTTPVVAQGVAAQNSDARIQNVKRSLKENVSEDVTVKGELRRVAGAGPLPPSVKPGDSDASTERNGTRGVAASGAPAGGILAERVYVPCNGTERGLGNAGSGLPQRGGRGPAPATRVYSAEEWVQGICDLCNDHHSQRVWELVVPAFLGHGEAGVAALGDMTRTLKRRINEQRSPPRRGAWLLSSLHERAAKIGVVWPLKERKVGK